MDPIKLEADGLAARGLVWRFLSYLLRNSLRSQLVIVGVTLALMPLYYLTLELPKLIINDVLSLSSPQYPADLTLSGLHVTELTALQLLVALCLALLAVALMHGVTKLIINVYKGYVAETMMVRLRHELFNRVIASDRTPIPEIGHGELVTIISAETEPVGSFFGDAIALPVLQGGLLATSLIFIVSQDWRLGLGALSLFPLQIWLFPKLIARRQTLEVVRVRQLRELAQTIAKAGANIREANLRQAATGDVAYFDYQLRHVLSNRMAIYRTKFLTYFLLNFSAQLTPFMFYLAGGYFVLEGQLTLGALVSAIAAYRDLVSPWEELVYYFQDLRTVSAKFDQIMSRFAATSDALPGLR